jgi:hypothetical protein
MPYGARERKHPCPRSRAPYVATVFLQGFLQQCLYRKLWAS